MAEVAATSASSPLAHRTPPQPMMDDADATLPPLSLDDPALRDYAIERELAGGGMARLFLARDRQLGRMVVIKVLAPRLAETLSVDRFRREIMLVTSLQHPNIVPVLSAGELSGPEPLPFFVMPFVDGESLRDRLLRGPLSVRQSVTVGRDVARALAYAHAHGVVHRDIKPGNILLTASAAQVSDFGVAKALAASKGRQSPERAEGAGDLWRAESARDPRFAASASNPPGGHTSLTAIGTSLGTPAYMAPEQAAADPGVDHRADIYALGIVLYEMLVGTPPFHGRSPQELLRAQLADAPPPIGARRYDVPATLAALIDQCLEKDPARRPKAMTDVLRRLEDPGVVSGAFAAKPVTKERRRSRRLLLAAYAAGLTAVGFFGWWAFPRGDADAADAAAPAIVPTTRRLVVGPLVAIGGDAQAATFIEGLTSELETVLVAVPGLRVARAEGSPGASPVAGATAATPTAALSPVVAPAFDALRLEGTVQREGTQVRVLLRAVDTGDGAAVWSSSFDGRADSLLALQGRVARTVATGLAAVVERPVSRPTP
jgi:serine/threonine-protein kinase